VTGITPRQGGPVVAAALAAVLVGLLPIRAADTPTEPHPAAHVLALLESSCMDCHDADTASGRLVIPALGRDLSDATVRDAFVLMHDRVAKGQMPPDAGDLPDDKRAALVAALSALVEKADRADVAAHGRVPLRRLNRHEYEHTLRDILHLPDLDISDRLPEDRTRDGFNKSAEGLDFSRIQLEAALDAAEAALRAAVADGVAPQPPDTFAAISTNLFGGQAFGEPQAQFFAKDSRKIDKPEADDADVECAIFRSAYWPYHGYPRGFVAKRGGRYRVRFHARAVHQMENLTLVPAAEPVPMTFRARAPSGPDVSGDVRAVGGLFDISPDGGDYETTVLLKKGQTIEYSLLGLAVPLARNVNGGAPTYRFPPPPPGGHPGVAFRSLEITGPLPPETWPPASHRVLFDDLPFRAAPAGASPAVEVMPSDPEADARRLIRRFVAAAIVKPLPAEDVVACEDLVVAARQSGTEFTRALLAGYRAVLCSPEFLYLDDPRGGDASAGTRGLVPLAQRLSYFLWDTRPDTELLAKAASGDLARPDVLHAQVDRLIADPRFERFITNFTDYWLDLRNLRRDEPDIRLYPEYRFDDYLVESMGMETRAFVTALVRDNLPARAIVDTDFLFANDRLARHYRLEPLSGHAVRRVPVPAGSPLGGLLTQAAIQKVTANGTNTSPVLRGAWVMTRLLGQPPPKPPESVPAVEPDIRGAKTIRDLLALHTKDSSCATCHRLFDPVGFALESFDICGGWRDRYRGLEEGEAVTGIDRAGHDFSYRLAHAVDPRGSLPDGRTFANIRGLKALLADSSRQLARNLLHQFTAYATGGPVRFSDRRDIEAILDACAADGYRVGDLVHGFVGSGIFRGREQEQP
jgi:mono/diheme cytochrome c family protein